MCETINAVPGTHYSVSFTVEKPADPKASILMLATPTGVPAFVGTLSVVQGQPLRQR